MGNEVLNLRKDLIDLDMEELKINRELYNLQSQINAKMPGNKKVRIKNNYKQYVERKLKALEEKKRLLFENENNINNNNKQTNNDKKEMPYNVLETGEAKNEEINIDNIGNNKLSLINKNSKESKNNCEINIINKENNNNNNNKIEMISNSESESKNKVKTIYTKKKSNKFNEKREDIKNNIKEEDKKANDNNYINNNNRYEVNNNNIKEDLDENLNINEYKRKFFEKLSSLGPRSNINKSMDNKNSDIVEELEVIGLSQNDILKDKLSDFFVGTSVATSSKYNQNNSSMHNHYYKNKAKSEISGVKGQLISSGKSNDEDGNNKGINSINYQNYDENEEFNGVENEKNGTGRTGEKYETEESINNKETGSNTNEKYKDNSNENINGKKMLKNNRNKSYFVLQDVSSIGENSKIKESEN